MFRKVNKGMYVFISTIIMYVYIIAFNNINY